MFTNRFRWLKLLLLGTLLSALCLANYLVSPPRLDRDIEDRLRRPDAQTEPLEVGFAPVVRVLGEGEARMLVWGRTMDVLYDGEPWKEGEVVSFRGWVTPEGRIRTASFTLHRGRWLKKVVSLLAVFVLAGAFILHARRAITRGRRACRT